MIRSQELSLATKEEIKTALRKQGVTDHRRITMKRNGESIQTNTYILTFNSSTIKIGFTVKRVELYVPAPLRCFKYQKFGYHKDICRGQKICGKFGEKNTSHNENECRGEKRCSNCYENHPAFSKTRGFY